jgi:hypothetical protein
MNTPEEPQDGVIIVKTAEIICIASGIFEGYARAGPFVVMQEFDLESFVAEAMKQAIVDGKFRA